MIWLQNALTWSCTYTERMHRILGLEYHTKA